MREVMLIIHFIGLAMGIGTSFAFLFLGIASSKMEVNEAQKFRMNTFSLMKMGYIGLTMLLISGGYLMTPYWKTLTASPLLIVKLVLVMVLFSIIGIIGASVKKAKISDAKTHLKKIRPLGRLALLTGITIVVLAVYNFH
jgi:uncharacterized membrane protein